VTDWRRLVPEVLGALMRRYGHFDACEDAVQEALLTATTQWPVQGWPAQPRGWLVTVASRRLADLRSDTARRRREEADALRTPPPPADGEVHPDVDARGPTGDDTLTLLFLCCHPALTPPSQVALTLQRGLHGYVGDPAGAGRADG
jgi:predicted RNA polymerase sigma factor